MLDLTYLAYYIFANYHFISVDSERRLLDPLATIFLCDRTVTWPLCYLLDRQCARISVEKKEAPCI